jgi:hypothetical protein
LTAPDWSRIPPSQQAEHHRQEEQDERKKAHKDRKGAQHVPPGVLDEIN